MSVKQSTAKCPLQLTIMALREAELPEGCTRTIYMCDDGKDPLKRDWVDSLDDDVIYVSGENSFQSLIRRCKKKPGWSAVHAVRDCRPQTQPARCCPRDQLGCQCRQHCGRRAERAQASPVCSARQSLRNSIISEAAAASTCNVAATSLQRSNIAAHESSRLGACRPQQEEG